MVDGRSALMMNVGAVSDRPRWVQPKAHRIMGPFHDFLGRCDWVPMVPHRVAHSVRDCIRLGVRRDGYPFLRWP